MVYTAFARPSVLLLYRKF